MADSTTHLTELCRTHEVGQDLIEQSTDPGQLLDGVLETCEQLVATKPARPAAELGKLRGLLLIARQARTLEEKSVAESEVRRLEQQLEDMGHELREAGTRADAMEIRMQELLVQDILAELDRGTSNHGPAAELDGLFKELSRVCHKINNPLTSLLGRSQMLGMKLGKGHDEPTEKMVLVIQESAQRVASYIQEMAQIVNKGREELLPPPEPDQDSAG